MATVRWTNGAADGNWTTGTNWSTGAVPSAGDDVYIEVGSTNITTGPASAINLASLTVGAGFTGSILTTIALGTVDVFTYFGRGLTAAFNMTAPITSVYLEGSRMLNLEGGTWGGTRFLASGGKIVAKASAIVTRLKMGTGQVEFYGNGTGLTELVNESARITSFSRNILAYTGGGIGSSLTLEATAALANSGNGVARIGPYSKLVLRNNGVTHDSIDNMGMIDTSGLRGATTITTLTNFPGGVYQENPTNLTVTNLYKIGRSSVSASMAGLQSP